MPLSQNECSFKTFQSYENDIDLHENEPVGGIHFHVNDLHVHGLVLRQRHLGNDLSTLILAVNVNVNVNR